MTSSVTHGGEYLTIIRDSLWTARNAMSVNHGSETVPQALWGRVISLTTTDYTQDGCVTFVTHNGMTGHCRTWHHRSGTIIRIMLHGLQGELRVYIGGGKMQKECCRVDSIDA